jgi:Transcriptional regulatory protein, C terminal/Domain of unknown function (DUF5753)
VLEALMRAAPAFLSAENLLEQAWDEHADPFTNAVFITISRLRRKLGEPPVIETRPGVGYRITVQVLPFDAGVHPSMVAPFTMMGFPDPEDLGLVNVENAIGTLFLEEPCPTKPRSGSR